MEGRSYSEFYRNSSEEMFIKTMMESTIGMPAPTMDMLGFKNLTQNFRTDSEELFKSWLTNGESSNGGHSTGVAIRPRQASRRISTELATFTNQTGGLIHKKPHDDILFSPPTSVAAGSSHELNSSRIGADRGVQASNLFLAKAWFHSSQPMTRSRSSELRKRYVAMQNSQPPIGMEVIYEPPENGLTNFQQELPDANGYNNIPMIHENPDQFNAFASPSNSCSSTFNNPQYGTVDKISSIVSMLKGTLERKKLDNQVELEAGDGTSFEYYAAQEVFCSASFNQEQGINAYENQETYQDLSTMGAGDNEVLRAIEESLLEGLTGPLQQTQMSTISQEPSQSESSAAPPPLVSNGFDVFNDPCLSAQAPSVCEIPMNQMRNGRSPEGSSRTKDIRESVYDNSKGSQKKGSLTRYGSITSTGSVERGDPTKKRRVERSRKMAEAKEKNSTPAIPSDTQSILKRCENLEKEVRSLKLNLAFMNRKDSEQTKQIEELEKQNQELAGEKGRLLEEIERIIAETGQN